MSEGRANSADRIRVPDAKVLVVFALALSAFLVGACGGERNERPDVILITVDTLRADHIGAYGSASTRTPRIDQLAREGTLFTRAVTPMPLTRPAHFSMFTSLYPREHGVLNNALALPEENTTLAERFRAAGYATGAFVGVILLAPGSGAVQGFETYGAPEVPKRTADQVIPEALAWVKSQPADKPLFLWIHLYDPHLPYRPPPEFRRGADPQLEAEFPKVNWKQFKQIARENDGNSPQRVLEHARALYRGEVEFTDFWLGRFLEGIEEMRGLDKTVVAFTADHGECFERGVYFEHSDCLYDGAISVPLILRHPSSFTPGSKNAAQVSLLDLAPTLLQAAGLPVPENLSGRAIQDLPPEEERYILLQYPVYQPGAASARSKRIQTIRSVGGNPVRPIVLDTETTGAVGRDWKFLRAGEAPELYEVGRDSSPDHDQSAREPAARNRMEAQLDLLLSEHPMKILDPAQVNEQMRKTLEALGYIDTPDTVDADTTP